MNVVQGFFILPRTRIANRTQDFVLGLETRNMKLETASKVNLVNIVNFVNMWKSDKFTA